MIILYIHTSYIDDTVDNTNHLKRDVSFSTNRPGEPVRAPDNSAAVKSCHLLVPAEMRPAETGGVVRFFFVFFSMGEVSNPWGYPYNVGPPR